MLAVQFHPRRRGSMVNKAIEIHDSVLENVVIGSAESVLHFKEVYIHRSAGRPGWDAGSGSVPRGATSF